MAIERFFGNWHFKSYGECQHFLALMKQAGQENREDARTLREAASWHAKYLDATEMTVLNIISAADEVPYKDK